MLASCGMLNRSLDVSTGSSRAHPRREYEDEVYSNVPNYHDLTDHERAQLYTPVQIETLRAQKLNLKQMIAAMDASGANSLTGHESFTSMMPTEQAVLAAAINVYEDPSEACYWSVCHTCRPVSMERAWLSLDAAALDDVSPVLKGSGTLRPYSDSKVVKTLGLRKPTPRPKATFESGSGVRDESRLGREDGLTNARTAYRVTITKLEGGRFIPHQSSRESTSDSSSTGVSSLSLAASTEEMPDLGSWASTRRELLGNGESNVSGGLPHQVEASEPLDVEGGIAVKEEAITHHDADIITQA